MPKVSAVAATSSHGPRGLGLRRGLLAALEARAEPAADFLELTPENWLTLGPGFQRRLRELSERYPCRGHGLSLDLGGPRPLDATLLGDLKTYLDVLGIAHHSDHLSFCADRGHLYELLPLPFTEEAVRHVSARIREASERLERRLALENASRYVAPGGELSEIEFLCAVLAEADCDLLLDVNNVFVNSMNHGFDPHAFIRALPASRIAWGHVAGHLVRENGCLVDTHGAKVVPEVWSLLETAFACHGVFPVVLERDANLPTLAELVAESRHIDACAARAQEQAGSARVLSATQRRAVLAPRPHGLERTHPERLRQADAAPTALRARVVAGPSLANCHAAAIASPTLMETLQCFSTAVRDPALAVPQGVDPERFKLYRELAGNNLEALLTRVFPILRASVGEAAWLELRTGFFRDYRAVTPYFPRLGGEFLAYLRTLSCAPWWVELAAWEWLEVEVRHDPAEYGTARVNPTLRLCHVEHAVHQLRVDTPTVPARTSHWLAVYRSAADAVRFAELTPVTVRLLQGLQASADSGEDELLRGLAEELRWPDPAQFQQAGREMIANLEAMAILSRRA